MPENDHERLSESNAKLKEMLLRRMPGPGDFQTAVEGLVLLRREEAGISEKTFEKPLAAFIIQGSKQSFFGGRDYFYRENQYLVAGLDMPASFRAMPATSEEPVPVRLFLSGQAAYCGSVSGDGAGDRACEHGMSGSERRQIRTRNCWTA